MSFKRQAKLLKNQRLELGITLNQVASHLDVSTQFVSKMEHGVAGIPLDKMQAVCKFLKVNPNKMANAVRNDFEERLWSYFG